MAYAKSKTTTINGSSAGDVTGYAVPVIVSPYLNPIKAGEWTINSKVYNYRIEIPITEVTGSALTDYFCMVELNIEWILSKGYIDSSNYYYCVFDRSENNIKLYKYVSGAATLLDSEDLLFTMNTQGTPYHMRIGSYGTGIKIWISRYGDDFDLLIDTSDSSLANTGNVGLIGLASTFYSNNLIISGYIVPEPAIVPEVPVASTEVPVLILAHPFF